MNNFINNYIIHELKAQLKEQQISYKALSEHLLVSEKTVNRILNLKQDLSLDRLVSICLLINIDVSDLVAIATKKANKIHYFNDEQDSLFSSSPELYMIFQSLLQENSISTLAKQHKVSRSDMYLKIRKLESANLVKIGVSEKVILLVPKHTVFHPNSTYASTIRCQLVEKMAKTCCNSLPESNSEVMLVNLRLTSDEYNSLVSHLKATLHKELKCQQHSMEDKDSNDYTLALLMCATDFIQKKEPTVAGLKKD